MMALIDDGLAGTSGARDEEVGHLGEVGDDGRPSTSADGDLERSTRPHRCRTSPKSRSGACGWESRCRRSSWSRDGREDAHALRREREGDIVLEAVIRLTRTPAQAAL